MSGECLYSRTHAGCVPTFVVHCRRYSILFLLRRNYRERDNIFGGAFAVCGIFINFAASYCAESPIGVRRVDNEHKGVTVRFGFDAIRTSQTLLTVKSKATGTPHEMSCIWLDRLCDVVAWHYERIVYAASAWGFQRCSFL